ncbi:hypothetical protein G7Y89_g1304 [Cudoniella acicularis]|uniref:Uncharacterized protein n=1 Tax=Cudoniella acicularis TaxID=354080 RepID=A0A8H4RVI9_9HELO|nr:hypothetical protein G7Y89_g1304 [Cudoniella acicularis]
MRPSNADVSDLCRTSCLVAPSDQCEEVESLSSVPVRDLPPSPFLGTAPDRSKLLLPVRIRRPPSPPADRAAIRATGDGKGQRLFAWMGRGGGGIARLHRDVSSSQRKLGRLQTSWPISDGILPPRKSAAEGSKANIVIGRRHRSESGDAERRILNATLESAGNRPPFLAWIGGSHGGGSGTRTSGRRRCFARAM